MGTSGGGIGISWSYKIGWTRGHHLVSRKLGSAHIRTFIANTIAFIFRISCGRWQFSLRLYCRTEIGRATFCRRQLRLSLRPIVVMPRAVLLDMNIYKRFEHKQCQRCITPHPIASRSFALGRINRCTENATTSLRSAEDWHFLSVRSAWSSAAINRQCSVLGRICEALYQLLSFTLNYAHFLCITVLQSVCVEKNRLVGG